MKSLEALIEHLTEDETIKNYQALEKVIEQNPDFKAAYQAVLDKQKQLVQAEHAQKHTPEKEKEIYDQALNALKDEVPVQQFLSLQADVNASVQMLFNMIEDALNAEIKRK